MSIFEVPSNNKNNEITKLESENNKREQKIGRIIALVKELSEGCEKFPFSGVESDSYSKFKADEEEFPGFATPIDALIERFNNEGIKIVFGKNPESGNVFVLPYGSDDIENDSILPQHLKMDEITDDRLKELVLLNRK